MGSIFSSLNFGPATLRRIYVITTANQKFCIEWPPNFRAFCQAIEEIEPGYVARKKYTFAFTDGTDLKHDVPVSNEATFKGLIPQVKTLQGDKTEKVQIWYTTCYLLQ